MTKIAICLAAAPAFTALMFGGSGTRAHAATADPPTSLVVIGNSLARHGSAPQIGWTGDWGMAASASDKDFAHLMSTALDLPLRIVDGAPAERDPEANGADLLGRVKSAITPAAFVVVELGENVNAPGTEAFLGVYDQLLEEASHGHRLICLSTYWRNPELDKSMDAACSAHGGRWVYIGDIQADPKNPDYQGRPAFLNPGVQRHPHDWSMAQIAGRGVAAAGRRSGSRRMEDFDTPQ